ncbi:MULTISPECIES: TM2 domain-containing protein [Enterococcus]|uniref:TM2 domain-containing protein n=1 Tax=Enterococcus TaxID=1350 RepID=UPI00100E9951|nr:MULTISPECIES: TM2 domain-containing protein [Enterococcus]RXW96315.1 hypothetical protein CYQ59_05720 [Enterococcus faecium]RXX01125.1 hypothetical protein CYQ57_01550 [Enterococcus faecium]TKN40551.1 TM2 domain-containing protein [Enterococcus faecium]TKN49154.1 TM2 domain-containing protein [Enterococcus faecium]TKN54755.1 TM2 domain-containing protein [Enterococcus faecium]
MEQYLAELSTNERILVNSEVEKNSKSSVVAWLLWWFTGTLGGHRYYMGKTGTAIIMTILTLTFFGLIISGPWALIDAFSINRWIRKNKEDAERKAIQNILLYRNKG